MNAAAIDLGTNSIKILIVRRDEAGHMKVLFRHRSVVRLGEGSFVKRSKGKIPRHVQLRTLKVMNNYARLLEAYDVDVVRATGTAAVRDAKNGPEFVREVREKTGIALEILPATEEARLIVKGVLSDLPEVKKPAVFVDIGGGSCEISLVRKARIEKFVSLPVGAVRVTEQFMLGSKPDSAKLSKLRAYVRKLLKEQWPDNHSFAIGCGSAGTIRALARVISKTELSDEDSIIKKDQLVRLTATLSRMTVKRISALPGVDAKRAEILTAGTVVLNEIFQYFGIESLRVSHRGLREGLLIDLFEHPQRPSNDRGNHRLDGPHVEMFKQLRHIARRYHADVTHAVHISNLAQQLFDELSAFHGLHPTWKNVLLTAGILHDVGRFVNLSSHHKHSFYIIRNTEIPFLNEREHLMAACVARYHRKSTPRQGHEGYSQLTTPEKKVLLTLASFLRLADGLDARRDQSVRWVKCHWAPGKVRLHIDLKPGATLNHQALLEKAKMFEATFKVTLQLNLIGAAADKAPRFQVASQFNPNKA